MFGLEISGKCTQRESIVSVVCFCQDLSALTRREPTPKGRLEAIAGKRRRTVGFEDHHPTGMTTASRPPSERGVDGIRSAGHPNTKAIVGRIVREQKMIVKR